MSASMCVKDSMVTIETLASLSRPLIMNIRSLLYDLEAGVEVDEKGIAQAIKDFSLLNKNTLDILQAVYFIFESYENLQRDMRKE